MGSHRTWKLQELHHRQNLGAFLEVATAAKVRTFISVRLCLIRTLKSKCAMLARAEETNLTGQGRNLLLQYLMLFRRGSVALLILCIILIHWVSMSFALIGRLCKHKRVAALTHKPVSSFRAAEFSRPFRLACTKVSQVAFMAETKVVLTNGEYALLRGKPRGGWYAVALIDSTTGIETVSPQSPTVFTRTINY